MEEVRGTFVYLGTDWSNPDQPALRLSGKEMGGSSFLLPLQEAVLRFRVINPEIRYCVGWFDLTEHIPRHITCRTWQAITSGKQCRHCQQLEGFLAVHQSHHHPERLREDVKRYLMQPHYLYVAMFAEGSAKVGTVSQSRLLTRPAEQGAIAAYYVIQVTDGLLVREIEEMVSSTLGIKQAMSAKRKLNALYSKVEIAQLTSGLYRLTDDISSVVNESDQVQRLPQPVLWEPSACALAALALTPVAPYGLSLKEGNHSLYVRGIIGSILVFGTDTDRRSVSYAIDLSDLIGRELEFGDFQSPQQFTQTRFF